MARFSYEIAIDASPEHIWETWMDLESWPEWAPAMKNLEMVTPGHVRAGSRVKIDWHSGPTATWEVTDVRPHEYFEWAANIRGVAVSAGHRITTGEEKTTVTLHVEYTGLMATIFKPMLMRTARKNVPEEAHGLRERCESTAEVPASE